MFCFAFERPHGLQSLIEEVVSSIPLTTLAVRLIASILACPKMWCQSAAGREAKGLLAELRKATSEA
jgi:hypothetical protein